MVDVFDSSVVVDNSIALSHQMQEDAYDAMTPSLVATGFSVSEWQGVVVKGNGATALVIGGYSNCFQGGSFAQQECIAEGPVQWQLSLREGTDGIWRLTQREGVDTEHVTLGGPGEPPLGASPPGPTPPAGATRR